MIGLSFDYWIIRTGITRPEIRLGEGYTARQAAMRVWGEVNEFTFCKRLTLIQLRSPRQLNRLASEMTGWMGFEKDDRFPLRYRCIRIVHVSEHLRHLRALRAQHWCRSCHTNKGVSFIDDTYQGVRCRLCDQIIVQQKG